MMNIIINVDMFYCKMCGCYWGLDSEGDIYETW